MRCAASPKALPTRALASGRHGEANRQADGTGVGHRPEATRRFADDITWAVPAPCGTPGAHGKGVATYSGRDLAP
jgi:hypothetical protein